MIELTIVFAMIVTSIGIALWLLMEYESKRKEYVKYRNNVFLSTQELRMNIIKRRERALDRLKWDISDEWEIHYQWEEQALLDALIIIDDYIQWLNEKR